MKKTIVFATGNANKVVEIRQIMADAGFEVCTMKEMGINSNPAEDGETYEDNALIKARAVADIIREGSFESKDGIYVMADDSGLEIDYLNKEPGVYSARYMGEDTSYHIKNTNLIERLNGVCDEKRTARFVCAIAAILPDGREVTTRGIIEGRIGYEEKGSNGFGYDPIFYVPSLGATTAELSGEDKNKVSHRGLALKAMKKKLAEISNENTGC